MAVQGEVPMENWPLLVKTQWTTWALVAVLIYVLIRYASKRLWPSPIPGIPYNKNVGILGDYPEIKAALKAGGARAYFWSLPKRHNSPIVQLFFPPFQKPSVIIGDYHEAHDIVCRRTKEFDRSTRSTQIFSPVIPNHHISMKSSDVRFKGNKELVRDLMTPSFLSNVSAPAIYSKAKDLIDLWELKMEAGQGHPFAAFDDISEATVDIILAVSFGFADGRGITRQHLESLSTKVMSNFPVDPMEPVEFSPPPPTPDIDALVTVNKSLHVAVFSPLPKLHHWILRKTKWKKAFQRKEEIITEEINKAVKRLAAGDGSDSNSKSAMDHMVLREMSAAKRAGRRPVFDMPSMRDELLGFLIGGSETSASVLGWIVKFLADNQDMQAKLRRQLRVSYAEAHKEERQPTASEIVQSAAPYLEAFIEESLRCTKTLPVMIREATVDTTIMGHQIPKGTTVMLMGRGASITEPAIDIADALRSKSSLVSRERVPSWNSEDVAQFNPERWLKAKAEGGGPGEFDNLEYDSQAGPMLSFGAGMRGCFGKRLAYLELRMSLVLLVWNFGFESCGAKLSSYEAYDVFTTTPRQCFVKLKKTTL